MRSMDPARARLYPTTLPPSRPDWSRSRRSLWTTSACVAALLVADWLAVFACLGSSWVVRGFMLPALESSFSPLYPLRTYVVDLYFLLPWTVALAQERLYTKRLVFWDEVRHTTRAANLAALFAIVLIYATKSIEEVSRVLLGSVWLTSLVVLPLARRGAKILLLRLGWWERRALILGAGATGRQMLQRIRGHRLLGHHPVGFLDDDLRLRGQEIDGVMVLGPIEDVNKRVRELGVSDVIIAMPRLAHPELRRIVARFEGSVESIHLVPDVSGLTTAGVETQDLDGSLLLHMRWNLARPWSRLIKRTCDVAGAVIAGLVFFPLVLVAVICVRFESGGPAFFVQDRLGRKGARFHLYKLRTMYQDAEARLEAHLSDHPTARLEWDHYAKLKADDPRITRVGAFLRRLSADEWPQLYNVLRGDMSLVGPRPYLPAERPQMGALAQTILKGQPGMTGLWQVSGRNELRFEQRLQLDEYYVRNWSLWMDIAVLIRTIESVIRGRGAY
jgi:Undecaprenyl-phosphate galactose phosphotransferase WbaP